MLRTSLTVQPTFYITVIPKIQLNIDIIATINWKP